nr:hypothetical protein [Salmonid herpesvirus 1]
MSHVTIVDYNRYTIWLFSENDPVSASGLVVWRNLCTPGILTTGGLLNGEILEAWDESTHGSFSLPSEVPIPIDRGMLYKSVVAFIWFQDIAQETWSLLERNSVDDPVIKRNALILLSDLKAEKPQELIEALFSQRVYPQFKHMLLTWWTHLAMVYMGRTFDLGVQFRHFCYGDIELTEKEIVLINSFKPPSVITPCKRGLKERQYVDKGPVRTIDRGLIGKNRQTKIILDLYSVHESVIDRLCWASALWWSAQKFPSVARTFPIWDRHFSWMDTATAQLPDQ